MVLILPICYLLFRGRGGTSGFYRGGRGRGLNQGYRGRGGGRGGFQPGRPTGGKKETLKFEGEYDFDQANEECFPQNPLINKSSRTFKIQKII